MSRRAVELGTAGVVIAILAVVIQTSVSEASAIAGLDQVSRNSVSAGIATGAPGAIEMPHMKIRPDEEFMVPTRADDSSLNTVALMALLLATVAGAGAGVSIFLVLTRTRRQMAHKDGAVDRL